MSVAVDKNLLFGLLALQNGLIDQVQLVAAFQAWTLDKARALADHLISLGHLNDAERAAVEAMADLHVAKHGDLERSLAAISAGRSTYESLARLGDPDIEATLAQIRSRTTEQDDRADADRTATYSVGSATSEGQRFRVLLPHARGGLGVVFVALDTELHREVALKQILDSHADDATSRHRFLLEAEITGGLEHPGIVPVYGLGAYGDGRPYYAMRFIRGHSLKEAIARFHADTGLKKDPGQRSLELRKLLRRFTDVCNAIDYASFGAACCTGTSSPATSSWADMVRLWWSTGGWPRPRASQNRAPTNGRSCLPRAAAAPTHSRAARWGRQAT